MRVNTNEFVPFDELPVGQRCRTGVYLIRDIRNGKFYVGSAKNLSARLSSHFHLLKHGLHTNTDLQDAHNSSASFEVLVHRNDNRESCFDLEQEVVDQHLETGLLFNIAVADVRSPNKGVTPSDETRARLSEARKGNKNALGHRWSDEERRRMSENRKGVLTGERNPMYGKTLSTGARKIISETHKGVPKSEEWHRNQQQYWNSAASNERRLAAKVAGILKRKPIVLDGNCFESIQDAAVVLGVSETTIARWVSNPSSRPDDSSYTVF